MVYGKIKDNVLVQKQPNKQEGFVKIPDSIICGAVHDGSKKYKEKNFSDAPQDFTKHLRKARNKAIYEGITFNGQTIPCDDLTQQRMIAIRIKAKEDENYSVNWKTEDGFIQISSPQIIAISDKIHDHVQKCFNAEMALSDKDFKSMDDLNKKFKSEYNK